ncbi:transposase domain-containing protein [Rhizophagus irregularis DAOM 181602=DAOM 197198]|nr:transposase domain-containing protein [Rhizophagus irregularis DAOM 181602=DAOM 197198]
MCVNSCCAFVGVLEMKESRLKLQFKNSKRSKELLYRHNYTNNIGDLVHRDIGDIFDGLIYKELLNDAYFPDPRDVAFTASCDGYQIFRQKTDDCWVFLFINNNLPQELRVKKENLMVTLIIPGPKQPQDFNSFLYPLIQEMKCYKMEYYAMMETKRIFLLYVADSVIFGTLNEMNRHVYYPLQQNIDPIRLPIRTHDEMLTSINQIEHLKGDRRETYIRNCGKFYPKNDERNSNNYTISSKTWIEIGEIMEKNRSNMPSDIGRPPRNIIKHSAGFKAVEWANWIILFSLPLLKGRLPQSYFLGWSNFVEAVQLCIQPRIDFEDLDKIRNLLIQFYNHYASSYGLEGERLPVYLIFFITLCI